jgi:hypothetical protein
MMNYALEVGETVIKLSGKAALKLLAMIVALLKENPKLKGATRIVRMLRENKPLEVLQMRQDKIKEFAAVAKQYGILYTVVKDKSSQDGILDLVIKQEDAAKVNRVLERTGAVHVGDAHATVETKSQEKQNPTKGRSKNTPSGNSSKTKEDVDIDKGVKSDRPSVREKINEIKASQPDKKQTKSKVQNKTRVKAPKAKVR